MLAARRAAEGAAPAPADDDVEPAVPFDAEAAPSEVMARAVAARPAAAFTRSFSSLPTLKKGRRFGFTGVFLDSPVSGLVLCAMSRPKMPARA